MNNEFLEIVKVVDEPRSYKLFRVDKNDFYLAVDVPIASGVFDFVTLKLSELEVKIFLDNPDSLRVLANSIRANINDYKFRFEEFDIVLMFHQRRA